MPDPKSKDFRRKQRQADFKDTQLEYSLIAGITKSQKIMEKVYLAFDSNALVSENTKWIYDKAVALYFEEGVLLDQKAFEHSLDVVHKKRKTITSVWKKIRKLSSKVTLASTLSARERLIEFYDARLIQICVSDIIGDLGKAKNDGKIKSIGDAKKTMASYGDILENKSNATVSAGDPRESYKGFKKKFKEIQKNPELIQGVATGIRQMDNQLLGLRNGEFGIIAGPSGGGKSIMLMDIATYCWQTQGDVAVITIEMPMHQYEMRWYCRLSGINYENFRKYDLNKKQWNHLDKTIEKAKKNSNKFILIDMPEGCTVPAVRAEVKSRLRNSNIKLIVIDYLNIMTGPGGKISMDWKNQLELAVEMKLTIARGFILPTWTVIQTTEDNELAFARHIKDQVDVGARIKQDENTEETGIVFMDWFKTRDFKGTSFSLQTNLDKMRFSEIPVGQRRKYLKINKKKVRKIKT